MKVVVVSAVGIALASACSGAADASARSFEQCQSIAVSRGIPIRKAHPDRYVMLKGFEHKTKPKGFMARCMAGEPV
jgi:hypothetical protein